MIRVEEVLRDIPHFETLCSMERLSGLVERLRADSRFVVSTAGMSVGGIPIHHVRFGSGSVKALIVAGPHCPEQIGSITVFSVLTLLQQGNRALLDADVEWHIVPCIDPDGAVLNEGWTQKPFTLESYMRNFFEQPPQEQVDKTFPISYKKVIFDRPTQEAKVLKDILDRVRPDFFYLLHNYFVAGGTWYPVSRGIDPKYYRQLHELLERHRVPLLASGPSSPIFPELERGVVVLPSFRAYYDYLERLGLPIPDMFLKGAVGTGSSEYLERIKPSALTFVTELVQLRHPSDVSEKETQENLRQLKLRVHADNVFLASEILDEWDRVGNELDAKSPFYRKIQDELVVLKGKLHESLPLPWGTAQIQQILANPADSRRASESARFNAYISGRFKFLCNAYCFVRLLKASKATAGVQQALRRLEPLFEGALAVLAQQIDFDAFEVIDCDTLAKVQLGSGLIALNSVLEAQDSVQVL